MKFANALVFLIPSAYALGINCRGSSYCRGGNGDEMETLQDKVANLIAKGQENRFYGTGRESLSLHIIRP